MRYDSAMNRGAFLFGAVAVTASAGVAKEGDREIPVELRGGRFFAVPRTVDGKTFACWLDTDGSGFIFDGTVNGFHLPVQKNSGKPRAPLPAFGTPSIPPLATAHDLPVFERGPAEMSDPILQGFEAQLGSTWFQGRTWRFDWPSSRCTMLSRTLAAADANVPLQIEGGYTRIQVTVASEPLTMTFDIAASLAPNAPRAGTPVVATTFVTRALFDRWRSAHPSWHVRRSIGAAPGIDEIIVPEMHAGTVTLRNVACTTRPGDDVFEGDGISGKLGANAFATCVAILDYRTSRLRLC